MSIIKDGKPVFVVGEIVTLAQTVRNRSFRGRACRVVHVNPLADEVTVYFDDFKMEYTTDAANVMEGNGDAERKERATSEMFNGYILGAVSAEQYNGFLSSINYVTDSHI